MGGSLKEMREAKLEAARESYAEGEWNGKAWAGAEARGQDLERLERFRDQVEDDHGDLESWFGTELMAPWSHAGLIAAAIIGYDDENDDCLDAERFADDLFPDEKAEDVDYLRGFVEGALETRAEA